MRYVKSHEKDTTIIDLDRARISQDFTELQSINEKTAKENAEKNHAKYADAVNYVQEKIGNKILLMSRNEGEGTHCLFSKELDPFDDLLPMIVTEIMTVIDTHKIDGLNYVAAIFNSVYMMLMEKANCDGCPRFDKENDDCGCTDDCDHCPHHE